MFCSSKTILIPEDEEDEEEVKEKVFYRIFDRPQFSLPNIEHPTYDIYGEGIWNFTSTEEPDQNIVTLAHTINGENYSIELTECSSEVIFFFISFTSY